MVEVDGVEGNKRRLPLWMQGKASKPDGEDKKNNGIHEVGHGVDSGNSKPMKQHKKAVLQPKNGETKTRKRKISQQDATCDVETVSSKKMVVDVPKIQERKIKATSVRLSDKDTRIPSPVDDDVELTPEDLLSIAKEYVKADKDISVQELSIKECELERQLSATASFSAKSENSLVDGNKRLQFHDTFSDSTPSLPGENHFINTRKTGDPAQDMLDLLLGPLLKKPVEEKRTEFISKDLTFPTEFGNQSQNDLKEDTAPLPKKKSTLRDKVAILLD